jgi:hypothetical protein
VFVAEPKPGALVLSDEQVMSVGTPAGVAPGETPASGARYEVLVSGVAPAPAPGTVVISSGDAPVAGKVVSTRDEAGNLVLTLELAPLPQLLARYHIDWEIDLAQFPLEPIIGETTDSPQAMALLKTAQTTSLNVVDCQSELKASLFSSKVSLTPHMDAKLIVQTSRNDPTLPPGFAKLALTGSQTVTGEVSVKLNAGFEGRVRCVASVPMRIPVTGALSVLVMPSLRVGAGFELEGSVIAVTGELTAKGTIGARETIGFQCGSQIAAGCEGIGTLEGISDFEFKKKMPSVNDMKVELSGQIFAYAGLNAAFGLGLLEAEILEARVGPKQSFELAFEDDQAHNPNVASNYKLEIAGSVEPGAAITTAIKKLIDDDNVSINLQVPFSTPLAESPKGSFDVSSAMVRYGTPVAFQVHLDAGSLRYPLLGPGGETIYNVDAVKIFRRREPDSEFTEFASIPASNGQSTFQYEWTPTSSDLGDYEFAAFVDTAMPVGYLEVATDTRKRLHVMGPGWYGNVTFAMRGSETQEDSGSYEDGSFTQTKTYGISASGTYRLEPLPDAPEAPVLKITASGTMTKTMAGQWDATYRSNGCDVTATQTEESIETATLAAVEGATGFLDIRDDGTVSVMIPNLFGRSHETYRVQASATRTGGPQCTPIAPTDRTTELDGSLSTDTIIAEGRLSEDQKSISANTRMTIEGMPDREYEVSVTLQR